MDKGRGWASPRELHVAERFAGWIDDFHPTSRIARGLEKQLGGPTTVRSGHAAMQTRRGPKPYAGAYNVQAGRRALTGGARAWRSPSSWAQSGPRSHRLGSRTSTWAGASRLGGERSGSRWRRRACQPGSQVFLAAVKAFGEAILITSADLDEPGPRHRVRQSGLHPHDLLRRRRDPGPEAAPAPGPRRRA